MGKVKHGMEGTRLYKIWDKMKQRCINPNNPQYKHYGGRGITLCAEWNEFAAFMVWAEANGYSDNLTIDRIDVDGNYCPINCRWIEVDALKYIHQLESAQPKWISVIDNPPNEGDIIFAHDPDEGWIALVKVIRVNLASIDVKAIWPEHSPPFVAKVWMPLRFPEPPKEE